MRPRFKPHSKIPQDPKKSPDLQEKTGERNIALSKRCRFLFSSPSFPYELRMAMYD